MICAGSDLTDGAVCILRDGGECVTLDRIADRRENRAVLRRWAGMEVIV